MPVLNGVNYLEQALLSIGSQADDEIEVIVVDGGSSDGTAEIVSSFTGKLPLRLFRCSHLKNWVASTNYGLSQARGDYVSILHQDDLWFDDRASVLRELVRRYPDAAMFLHASWFIDSGGKRIGMWQ